LAAKINDDGTITALRRSYYQHANIFEGFDGFTVEQIQEEARRAKAWYKMWE
jgi:hypothetical protein